MPQVQAQRRIVKSHPELWTELSDAEALARHLGEFGEIRITRVEPETMVAWEGERATGSVEIESSGWGTKVILTVDVEDPEPVAVEPEPEAESAPEPEPEPEPDPDPEPAPDPPVVAPASVAAQRRGFFARLFKWDDRVDTVIEQARETVAEEPEQPIAPEPEPAPAPEPEPEPLPEPEPAPEPEPTAEESHMAAVLEHVLDQLGQAHHRPFSRA
jgi:outer membrane biosynthesis protein TonB